MKMKKSVVSIIFIMLASVSVASEQVGVVIKKEKQNDVNGMTAMSSSNNDAITYEKKSLNKDNLEAEMARLRMEDGVKAVERDYVVSNSLPSEPESAYTPGLTTQGAANQAPNDPQYGNQDVWKDRTSFYKGQSNIEKAFVKSIDKNEVNVAVIDGGFRDTTDMTWKGGYNFSEVDDGISEGPTYKYYDSQDCKNGHGQAVGQLIGAKTNNGYGMAGVVDANMYAVRALGCDNNGLLSDVSESIRWASGESVNGSSKIAADIDVINISISGGANSCPSYLQDAINSATQKGISVVVAAGNSQKDVSGVAPANCDNVITVSSIDRDGGQSWFTNYGGKVDVAMKGNSVLSVGSDSGFSYWSGTSFSSPLTAGVIALGKALDKNSSPLEIENFVKQATNSFKETEEPIGTGIVDANQYYDLIVEESKLKDVELKHALSTERRCDDALYTNDKNLEACDVFEIIVNKKLKDDSDYFSVFRVDEGKSLTVSNGTIVASSQQSRFTVKKLDKTAQYGIQVCSDKTAANCANSDLIDLKMDEVSIPKSCQ